MAGPSIVVRVLGDLKNLEQAFVSSGKKAGSAASTIHGAFSSMLGTLNRTGILGPFGESLTAVDESLDRISEHGKTIGKVMLGVGGALTGVGLGLQAIGSKDQAAHQQLQAAVTATGASYDEYDKKIEAAIKHQEKFGDTANQTQDALRVLTQATGSPTKALAMLGTATDLAAAKHEDLTSAATALGKVYNGNTKLLKEFGVVAGVKASVATKALESATKQAAAADQRAADAKQHLVDLQARLAGSNKQAVISTVGVAAAQDRLAAAQRHLSQLMAVDATKKKLTLSQEFALQNAHLAVTKATNQVAAAQGKYSSALATAAGHGRLSIAQQQELRNAEQKVAATAAAATAAHKKMGDAHTLAGKAAHSQADAITGLSTKLHGQAAAAADTFTGHLDALKAKVEDAAATFGQHYGPAITGVGTVLAGLGGAMETAKGISQAFKKATEAATVATDAQTAATDAATVSEGLALGPILLIVAAIAALVVAAYLIYRNWKTIWAGMKAAVLDVWNWIKANWPLLLSILLGPVTAAIYQIYKHWGDITSGAQAVLNWFRTAWTTITGYITAPFTAAWQAISRGWDTVVGAIAKLPGRIAGAAAGMWHGITEAFRGAINAIIDIWNSLHFTLPSAKVFGHKIGGETLGVPQIPHMSQGGLITGSGIVYAHAGEVITPAPAAGRSGPAVVVQSANFNSGVDVETFMRKAAWVVQTQRI